MTLEERVIVNIKKNLNKKQEVTLESSLVEDLNVDSFDKLMIIAALEDEFSITIDEEDFKDVYVVSDIVKKLEARFATEI